MIEHEVKLRYPTIEAARQAIIDAGGRLVHSRRLIDDTLYDSTDARLRRSRSALRVRRDGARTFITFKGPRLPGLVKSREEFETSAGDVTVIGQILRGLALLPVFRSQKHREEYESGSAHVALDETPFGVFIEIEASPDEIDRCARRLGRTAADYEVESYPSLWRRWCAAHGREAGDMLFEDGASDAGHASS